LTDAEVERLLPQADRARAVKSNLAVYRCRVEEIDRLEKVVKQRLKLRPSFQSLLTVDGSGPILGMTIMLETGAIGRFAGVGQFASYCRCVDSQKSSQGKRKGSGNTKNGNRYLAWALVEAANFAIRYHPHVKRFYQTRKNGPTGWWRLRRWPTSWRGPVITCCGTRSPFRWRRPSDERITVWLGQRSSNRGWLRTNESD
jgi:transposase